MFPLVFHLQQVPKHNLTFAFFNVDIEMGGGYLTLTLATKMLNTWYTWQQAPVIWQLRYSRHKYVFFEFFCVQQLNAMNPFDTPSETRQRLNQQ